jgi:NAD(P)-dependent dehydrogenase (short-subunit alcohol dehydrogenase family)
MFYAPAGLAHMTMADWARFIAIHLRGDSANPHRQAALLGLDTFAELHTTATAGTYSAGWLITRGGWAKGERPGDIGRCLWHGGRIVNLSSGLARFSLPGYAAYAAMKGGIEVLTRYMAKELGSRRIAVNAVAPGAIETDFGGGAVRDNKQINDFIASQTALGRVGLPDDIGGAVASLLSDDSGWINGQRVEVSGGVSL